MSASNTDIIASLRHVYLTYEGTQGPLPILEDINLGIHSGEKISLQGPSGSGKTSLLMLLSGLYPATEGDITIDGASLTSMNEDALANFRRGRIGIIFQNFHLLSHMTALENVMLPLLMLEKFKDNARSHATDFLHRVGLGERLHHYPGKLSGGEQQRVAIARALAPEPILLLADEPTGNLDNKTSAEISDLLFDITGKQAFFMVTHDTGLANRCGVRLVLTNKTIVPA